MSKTIMKDPLGLVGQQQQPQQEIAARSKETARMENTQIGICPVCAKSMPVVEAAGVNCYVCEDDCICLPTADN